LIEFINVSKSFNGRKILKDIMVATPVKSVGERTILRVNPDKTIKIKDIMQKDLITVNQEESIIDILEVIKKEDINFVPVTDDENKLPGLLTKSSLLSILSDQFIDMEVDVNE